MGETTARKSAKRAAEEAEDRTRGEISELFLLLKSGRLTPDETIRLKARLDELIMVTEFNHQKCCGK